MSSEQLISILLNFRTWRTVVVSWNEQQSSETEVFSFSYKIEVICLRKETESVSHNKCSIPNPRLKRKPKMSAIPNINSCRQTYLKLKQVTVCISINFVQKYTLTTSKKSISLSLFTFPVKTLRLCIIYGADTKHMSYYFVHPSKLSVNIRTDFLKCNPFFSKAHNSWNPQQSATWYCHSGPKYYIYIHVQYLFVVVFVSKFEVEFHVYIISIHN
jgi:hypothetical protein